MPKPGKYKARKFFVIVPDARYCILTDKVSETANGVSDMWTENGSNEFYADCMKMEHGTLVFKLYGKKVAHIEAENYTYKLKVPSENLTEKHRFARVTFTNGGRGYDYIADGIELSVGDKALVSANGEEKEVTVTKVFELSLEDMPSEVGRYKKILKKI
jgi:hypothetical protein